MKRKYNKLQLSLKDEKLDFFPLEIMIKNINL